jgi:hypothetical protein
VLIVPNEEFDPADEASRPFVVHATIWQKAIVAVRWVRKEVSDSTKFSSDSMLAASQSAEVLMTDVEMRDPRQQ